MSQLRNVKIQSVPSRLSTDNNPSSNRANQPCNWVNGTKARRDTFGKPTKTRIIFTPSREARTDNASYRSQTGSLMCNLTVLSA
ncbi:hypothetical protein TcasGA2_TC010078 [Tribolium castaneum]|uniref:Uncharacterized protein n=1 Tax=Tribolium castaneum TaxID=7070 RepID=D6WS58_TRICA|nr:hypothetical protein TcasGA2_TC010078 [Tribolium castaneum]